MKTITKWVNEVSGAEFKTEEEARKSEAKSLSIKDIFAFWKEMKDPKGSLEFSNGGWCYQRSAEDLLKLTKALVKAIELHEPWVVKEYYAKHGGMKKEFINAGFLIGRILSEGGSPIYHWLHIHGCICPKCYREYGQQYYAINCKCDGKIKTREVK